MVERRRGNTPPREEIMEFQKPQTPCCQKHVFEVIGWLSADIPELHHVEVPKLMESYVRFRAAIGDPYKV